MNYVPLFLFNYPLKDNVFPGILFQIRGTFWKIGRPIIFIADRLVKFDLDIEGGRRIVLTVPLRHTYSYHFYSEFHFRYSYKSHVIFASVLYKFSVVFFHECYYNPITLRIT